MNAIFTTLLGKMYAVKSVVKSRVKDLQIFINEINILRELVSASKDTRLFCALFGRYRCSKFLRLACVLC